MRYVAVLVALVLEGLAYLGSELAWMGSEDRDRELPVVVLIAVWFVTVVYFTKCVDWSSYRLDDTDQ